MCTNSQKESTSHSFLIHDIYRPVKILDPFTGTGTFLTRLLESDLITSNMYEKYTKDMFAAELMLLAYYISTVNIETTYSSLRRGNRYVPFAGISYTDTLRINPRYREGAEHRKEQARLDSQFRAAHERIMAQRGSHVHVIVGNPPYSAGQSNYNDQNQNIQYPDLDARIKHTYLKRSNTANKVSLYDSYIRSLRWVSDRIGDSGIVALITNAGFLRSEAGAGIRASLEEEFSEIWCFDLRGKKGVEGDGRNIFEYVGKSTGGTTVGTVIVLFVKNPPKQTRVIKYAKLEPEHYSGQDKRDRVKELKSIVGIDNWIKITPDNHHDWLDQRGGDFAKYAAIGDADTKAGKKSVAVFRTYSRGVATARDAWVYNSDVGRLADNMKRHIDYCNKQNPNNPTLDPKQAKWSGTLSKRLRTKSSFSGAKIRFALYRPFFKQRLYFDRVYNEALYRIPKLFPYENTRNITICVPYKFTGEFYTFITDITPDLEVVHHSQCFSLHAHSGKEWKDNITDSALAEYRSHYNDPVITKLNIFYYIYGILHHPGYRKKFANNLTRELPRIPPAPDFAAFRNAGKNLADLHLNFETCKRHSLGAPRFRPKKFSKLSFGSCKNPDTGRKDRNTTVLRADGAVIFDKIPRTTYKVNGRTPLEWVVDRYKITTNMESGITNDPCAGTDIIAVIERAVHVGLESERIIRTLPKEFEPGSDWAPSEMGLARFTDGDTLYQ